MGPIFSPSGQTQNWIRTLANRGRSLADTIQGIDRPVVMLSKDYQPGSRTDLHAHPRAQFLYAQTGTMRAWTEQGSWIVPPGYGLLIPAEVRHEIEMFGPVALRSAYIETRSLPGLLSETCSVIPVSPLLSASIDRFSGGPLEYSESNIFGHLAAIIIAEISSTRPSAMVLPFPTSPKLKALAKAIISAPSDQRTIDDWAAELAMSRRSFTRAFRKETGITFDQWRQRLRYQAASEMIASGTPLARVAARVGYSSATALKSMMNKFS